MRSRLRIPISLAALLCVLPFSLAAQAPATPPAPAVRARPTAYPTRPPADPALVERGKAIYGVNCNFCHGSDARGGEGGPNLLRSEMVLNDVAGENIRGVIRNGRMDQGMPKFPLSDDQISEVAAYIHSFKVGGYDISRMTPPSILVGDAKAGEVYFTAKCASCHSATGDLKGLGSRIPDAKVLQTSYLVPGGVRFGPGAAALKSTPATVTVTTAKGKVEGRLVRIDDFAVTLATGDGAERTFRRDGDVPKVEIHDPMAPHKALLPQYTDKDIHDLTAYLVTLK